MVTEIFHLPGKYLEIPRNRHWLRRSWFCSLQYHNFYVHIFTHCTGHPYKKLIISICPKWVQILYYKSVFGEVQHTRNKYALVTSFAANVVIYLFSVTTLSRGPPDRRAAPQNKLSAACSAFLLLSFLCFSQYRGVGTRHVSFVGRYTWRLLLSLFSSNSNLFSVTSDNASLHFPGEIMTSVLKPRSSFYFLSFLPPHGCAFQSSILMGVVAYS